MFQTNVVQKIKAHILESTISPKYHSVYEIIWENIVEPTGHRWRYGACALHAEN